MPSADLARRSRVLPHFGHLLVTTDLHGNLEDFLTAKAVLQRAWNTGLDAHWALLGDLVHGPDARAAADAPEVYGFEDQSPELIDALFELVQANPLRVHVVLGNHDAGHLGFKHTSKFHPDEVEALEARLTPSQRERLGQLCSNALLALVAPCGLLLSHGAPGNLLTSLAQLDGPLPPARNDEFRNRAVNELLWSYGQQGPVAAAMLARISAETGHRLKVAVHGHDRDHSGWFIEGGNQVQPVIFGAPRENKRYLWIDLARTVDTPEALIADSLRHLYPLHPAPK
jgi:Calcineurin-like phosphoesterase